MATDNYLDNTVTAEKRPSDSNTTSKTAKKRKTTSYARGEQVSEPAKARKAFLQSGQTITNKVSLKQTKIITLPRGVLCAMDIINMVLAEVVVQAAETSAAASLASDLEECATLLTLDGEWSGPEKKKAKEDKKREEKWSGKTHLTCPGSGLSDWST